ncbi:hypothetical protein GR247_39105 [Rhizobium leguminosarum]|uniref:Uncharacterized protein n=1 Tax=Rhizobium leguminosarum TaxID=384 RepID=A0A6P0C5L5_RHILE|nr:MULTISPECIES: hypothetical protein [Rhizobium]MBY3348931.1 hypothetical protein [Rhizobium laguerreae]MBY3356177.1 hypothetical protein [Rhizobium laguerreae]MBY3370200.1 hypothetical protein [Rhizobium laguerreae]MBY3377085.1 hypothetical protein [Rhizobium laguerreae]MBY3391032.1 hypothetical protein [Rhizobium laguerreae]
MGIVNLTDERPAKDAIRRYLSCSGNFRPQAHRRRAQFAMVAGGDVVARVSMPREFSPEGGAEVKFSSYADVDAGEN